MSDPKPNPQWTYSPPKVSARGDVWVDAMQLPMALELYRLAGVKPAEPRTRK